VTYLLDTMVVSYFLQAGREDELSRAAQRCKMALVEEVRQELERDRDRGGQAFRKWLDTSNIDMLSIEVGSNASITLAQLLDPASPTKGRGERASIALAASEDTLTFVTHDKNGMWLALREIWILGLPVFLRRLFEQGVWEDPVVLDQIISLAVVPAQRPTWWASWRAGLASGRN